MIVRRPLSFGAMPLAGLKTIVGAGWRRVAALLLALAVTGPAAGSDTTPAKQLFGAQEMPSQMPTEVHGFYSMGCLSGGIAIPADGPYWQAMRPSRNRGWGHPDLIEIIERLSRDAAQKDGWPGLLVGDLSQPRGGPMLSGHASHQSGLDADIWLTPMPKRRLNAVERENTSAISVLKAQSVVIDPDVWTDAHARLIMRAASYPRVQRVLVHPAIKRKLCDSWTGDRLLLRKVRPYYGHHYHMHVRILCPRGSQNCKAQNAVPRDIGCGKALDWWFDVALKPKKPSPPKKASQSKPPRQTLLSDLPAACALVLNAPSPGSEAAGTSARSAHPASALPAALLSMPALIPVPKPRPVPQ